jgi:hypothetical protein
MVSCSHASGITCADVFCVTTTEEWPRIFDSRKMSPPSSTLDDLAVERH